MGKRPVRKEQPNEADMQTWYTRGEAADVIGCSRAAIVKMERRVLHPHVDEYGVHRFSPGEVQRIAERRMARSKAKEKAKLLRPGDMASQVFAMFEKSVPVGQIVIRLRITPTEVANFWRQYQCRSPSDLLHLEQQLKREEREREEQQRQQEAQERFELELAEGQKSFTNTLAAIVGTTAKK